MTGARHEGDIQNKLQKIASGSGQLTIDGKKLETHTSDLQELGELGNGTSGQVIKMRHISSNTYIAVKVSLLSFRWFEFLSIRYTMKKKDKLMKPLFESFFFFDFDDFSKCVVLEMMKKINESLWILKLSFNLQIVHT